ncbi:hypothetical protein Tco_1478087, partial [Tanacetum coccineum]
MLLIYDLLLHVILVLSSTYVGKILGADQLLVILCYRYQESGIGYWILSMTISGSGVTFLPSCCNGSGVTFLPIDEDVSNAVKEFFNSSIFPNGCNPSFIALISKIVSWCKSRKQQALLFKVDFQNAFDSVKWDRLDDIL